MQLSWRKSLLDICKILGLFVSTLTLLNGENLRQPIQMQISEKQRTFSQLFSAVLKSNLYFEDFQ